MKPPIDVRRERACTPESVACGARVGVDKACKTVMIRWQTNRSDRTARAVLEGVSSHVGIRRFSGTRRSRQARSPGRRCRRARRRTALRHRRLHARSGRRTGHREMAQAQRFSHRDQGIWWGAPSGAHTADRAMAMLPKFFESRMDECGIDFAHMLTTYGIGDLYLQDEDLRIAFARSVNTMYADIFRDVQDRVRPVAIVPTNTPEKAIRELEFAVLELGHKAVMIGTEIRAPWPEVTRDAPQLGLYAPNWRSIAYDAPH